MFDKVFNKFDWGDIRERIYSAGEREILGAIDNNHFDYDNILYLFSPGADKFLERIAGESYRITRERFGNTIQLYAPLYISNECTNGCLYCGFNASNKIARKTLTPDEVYREAEILYNWGFRHILLLTGENRKRVPVSFISDIVRAIHKKFSSISIEMYPMEIEEYEELIESGVDGLTLYQETYNRSEYDRIHPFGKKKDFYWRLNGSDRGGIAGFRRIGIGSLLGLSDWRVDGFFTALHALYLSRKYWKSQIQVSFPRLREAPGNFRPLTQVCDRDLTHLVCVLRLILNDSGLILSTRESQYLRDNIFPLGITSMSAGSKTSPGGYSGRNNSGSQFAIEDTRSPEEISEVIKKKGYDPVWKDWDKGFF